MSSATQASLVVLCKRAEKLKNSDWFSLSDPFVSLHIENKAGSQISSTKRTRTIDNNLNPTWDEIVILDIDENFNPMECTLKIQVFDEDDFMWISALNPNDLLGEAEFALSLCRKSAEFQDIELVVDKKHSSKLQIALNTQGDWGNEVMWPESPSRRTDRR